MHINKLLLAVTILILTVGFTACQTFRAELMQRDDKAIAETRLQEIIQALENEDKEGLKSMFSLKAIEEAEDIDAGIDYITALYKGNIISKDLAQEGSASINDGGKTSEVKSFYTVTTDVDEYIIFFIDQLVDTKNPNNLGLYMLQIIKLSDREKYFDWGSDTRCAGIYRPTEEDESINETPIEEDERIEETNREEVKEESTETKEHEIRPFIWEEKVADIHLLMTVDEVLEKLGEPLEEEILYSETVGKITTLIYENLELEFLDKLDNKLIQILVDKEGATTVRDIKIGDNIEVLNNTFYLEEILLSEDKTEAFTKDQGNVYYQKDQDAYTITYYDDRSFKVALIFEVKDNIIRKARLIDQTV